MAEDRGVEWELLRFLVEGEKADKLDILDVELVQPLLEGDVLDPDHDSFLQKVLSPLHYFSMPCAIT